MCALLIITSIDAKCGDPKSFTVEIIDPNGSNSNFFAFKSGMIGCEGV